MKSEIKPLVITCGDPAGVGTEVAVSAWKALKEEIPICLIIDPQFLPSNININALHAHMLFMHAQVDNLKKCAPSTPCQG